MKKKQAIFEFKPEKFFAPSRDYSYVGESNGDSIFECDGQKEIFARRSTPYAGWQLKMGKYYYEFVSSVI